MAFKRTILKNLSIGLLVSVQTSNALAIVEANVTLVSPLFGETFISANIDGFFDGSCYKFISRNHELVTNSQNQRELRIFLNTEKDPMPCATSLKPFQKKIFIGDLEQGNYVLKLFKNESKVLTMNYSVPNDVMPISLDVDKYYLGNINF